MENPLQCSCHRFLASFVKEIMLPFSKLKSWLKTQPIICKFLITSARGRCTKVREAYDANNASSMSKVSSTNYLKTVQVHLCFSSGITSMLFSLRLHVCVVVFVHEKGKVAVFSHPLSCHFPPCLDHVLLCIPSGVHCLMYHDRDTFDFSQGHVTKNQPMAVSV